MLILVGVILITIASVFYLGAGAHERSTVMRAARDGAENTIAALGAGYGSEIDIERLGFDAGTITIHVVVRGGPPPGDGTIRDNIRGGALKFIHNAIAGSFPRVAGPVKTRYYTYNVAVGIRRVTK
jgi:hypothetical protein